MLSGTHPSQQVGSDQGRSSRSYALRGGLGDPSCGRGCCGPQLVENAPRDHELFRVFTGAQPESLRQLDVIPVAFSALSRSFLVRLLFISSLQCRGGRLNPQLASCLACESPSRSRSGQGSGRLSGLHVTVAIACRVEAPGIVLVASMIAMGRHVDHQTANTAMVQSIPVVPRCLTIYCPRCKARLK